MECRTKMLNYECPILNIGDRKGSTSYIDFIQEKVDVWFAACQGDTKLVAAPL